jgi:hypothetical protein
VKGVVFGITDGEQEMADDYETSDYQRVQAPLGFGELEGWEHARAAVRVVIMPQAIPVSSVGICLEVHEVEADANGSRSSAMVSSRTRLTPRTPPV